MNIHEHPSYLLIKEKHPHLAPRFSLFWGQPDFEPIVTDLIIDTRGDKRKGFDPDVVAAILNLMEIHDKEFPRLAYRQNDTDTDFRFR